MNVCEEIQDVLVDFHDKKKHIGLSNTSSILVVRAFDDLNLPTEFQISIGDKGDSISQQEILSFSEVFGLFPCHQDNHEGFYYNHNLIVNFPTSTKSHSNHVEVYENIGFMINNIIKNLRGEEKNLKILKD